MLFSLGPHEIWEFGYIRNNYLENSSESDLLDVLAFGR